MNDSEKTDMMNDLPLVSVVILMYNEAEYIEKCLDSILHQDYPEDRYEILVADGLSTDGSSDIVRRYSRRYPQVTRLENPKRIRPAAMNVGIKHASGKIVIILGAHSTVPEDFISLNVQTLKTTSADCVGGTVETIGESFTGKAIALGVSHPFGVGNSLFRYSKKAQYVDTVAFGAYKKEVFENIGLFDEELDTNEDYEFNYRLLKAGRKIFLNPEIQPCYYSRGTLSGLSRQYFRFGKEKVTVVYKYRGACPLRYRIPPLFILSLVITGLLGFFMKAFLYLFLGQLFLYLSVVLFVSLRLFFSYKKAYTVILPGVLIILHFSFGTGFLFGIVRRLFQKSKRR